MVFTEGTIIMHKNARGLKREDIVKQNRKREPSTKDYISYIPIKNAVDKLNKWKNQKAKILYLTSRRKPEQIKDIKTVLKKYKFPEGKLLFRRGDEEYKDVPERVTPDILVEDDCESIEGIDEMTITHIKPEIKKKIKSVVVKEFEGIDHLPDNINELLILS